MQVIEREFSAWDIDADKWTKPKPFGFSGCFRVCNDAQFLRASILSHLPYLDECVIALQPSTDGSEEIAYQLQDEYSNVRVVKYPVKPHFVDHPAFHTDPLNSIYSFVYLSNWALSICKYAWIVKAEADVICLPTMHRIIDEVAAFPKRPMYYGRVILNVAGAEMDKVSFDNPRNGGWDECVIPNHPDYHYTRSGKWEVLGRGGWDSRCMGWSALHMKRCKAQYANGWNGERWVEYDRDGVAYALRDYNGRNPYPAQDNPLGDDCLFDGAWRQWLDLS